MPSAVGYQPTLATEMGDLQERITSTKNGSITSVQADLRSPPMTSPTRPGDCVRAPGCDRRAVTRDYRAGIYPAVDPLASSSRILDAQFIGERHYKVATDVQKILQRYKELQEHHPILGMDEL